MRTHVKIYTMQYVKNTYKFIKYLLNLSALVWTLNQTCLLLFINLSTSDPNFYFYSFFFLIIYIEFDICI